MPFCKTCGTLYTKSLGVCPKCNANDVMLAQPAPTPEEKRTVRRQWLGILIGIPGTIAFIALLYSIMHWLKQ